MQLLTLLFRGATVGTLHAEIADGLLAGDLSPRPGFEVLRAAIGDASRALTNHGFLPPAGARTVYQFTPDTRRLFMQRYSIDPWSSPEAGAQAAALHLRETYDRTGSWGRAVTEYIGGPDPRHWGPQTRATPLSACSCRRWEAARRHACSRNCARSAA